jgi:CheY-like chemotaxis protein
MNAIVGLTRLLAAGSFDAVLMELHLPDMDGLDVTRGLRAAR